MTDTSMLVAIALLTLVAGGVLGYVLAAARGRGGDQRADAAEAELAEYRSSVTDHFQQTAVQFRDLSEQYRTLHEHLAHGAEALCDVPEDAPALRFVSLAEIEGPSAEVPQRGDAVVEDQDDVPPVADAEAAPPPSASEAETRRDPIADDGVTLSEAEPEQPADAVVETGDVGPAKKPDDGRDRTIH